VSVKRRFKMSIFPCIKKIETVTDESYNKCKATVELEISNGDGSKKDIVIEYPMQGANHLTMLMVDKETKKDITHIDKFEISDVIMKTVKQGNKIL
jgi:hypothetical protein